MTYIKNLMLVIVSAIMGTASTSLFEGWSTTEQRIVFVVSVLMVAMMMAKSSTRSKSRKKAMKKRTAVKRKSLRGKRRSRSP
jgi:membrane protein implicated in regulation of membrane protease activity